MRKALASIAALLLVESLEAQTTPTPTPKPCTAPQHRQFDFWIGEWEVLGPKGNRAGENSIRSILNGCVLQESWKGASGMSGQSYNVYDAARKRWHQTWVDDEGTLLQIEGGLVDGKMVLSGEHVSSDPPGKVLDRITWSSTGSGRLRQLWEKSTDGGKTWKTAFDGTYVRKP
jgi:hypothetical protein